MANKDEIETAIKVITEVAGDPSVGVIADLVKELKGLSTTTKEARVIEAKETR